MLTYIPASRSESSTLHFQLIYPFDKAVNIQDEFYVFCCFPCSSSGILDHKANLCSTVSTSTFLVFFSIVTMTPLETDQDNLPYHNENTISFHYTLVWVTSLDIKELSCFTRGGGNRLFFFQWARGGGPDF